LRRTARELAAASRIELAQQRQHAPAEPIARAPLVGVGLVLDPFETSLPRASISARVASSSGRNSRGASSADRIADHRHRGEARQARAAPELQQRSPPGRPVLGEHDRISVRARERRVPRRPRHASTPIAVRRGSAVLTRQRSPYRRAVARANRAQSPAFGLIP
jgi:hypothetical protein